MPNGLKAALKPIPKGASSVDITFSADNQPQLAEFTAVLEGTLKKGNQPHVQPAPGLALKLEEPFHLSIAAVSGKLARKGQLKLKITARRNPAFRGEITLACSSLPKGVKAVPAKLAAGATEQELVLTAAPDVAVGAIKDARVRGESKVGSNKFSVRIPLAGIVVE